MNIAIDTPLEQDWGTRRLDAQARLSELRNARGVALLDGRPFDDGEITRAEAELDAIEVAQVEAARRGRDEAAAVHRQAVARKKAKLRKMFKERMQAVDDAENACVGLMLALKAIHDTDMSMRGLIADLGYRLPAGLSAVSIELRLSLRISDALSAAIARSGKFGRINFAAPSQGPRLADGTRRSDSWRDTELTATGAAITSIIEEDTSNDV
jgi:hypothetical protein